MDIKKSNTIKYLFALYSIRLILILILVVTIIQSL